MARPRATNGGEKGLTDEVKKLTASDDAGRASGELLVQNEPGENEVMSPEDLAELAALSGMGLENVGIQDVALPFLVILQALSPQCNKRGPEYVEGAEPGMIFNTVTNALYDELEVVACAYKTRYTEWKPRDQGGGLVRDWGEDSSMHDKCGRDERNRVVTPTGTNIVKSATFFGLINPSQERFVVAFSSTQLKKGRQWLAASMNDKFRDPRPNSPTFGQMVTPPLFFKTYKLTTVGESNEKGDWFGWRITPGKPIVMLPDGKSMLNEAKRLAQDVTQRKVQVKVEQLAGEASVEGGLSGDKIPF